MPIIGACVVVACVTVMLVGLCALTVKGQKEYRNKMFDERQLANRGKAYEFAMLFAFVYYGIIAVILSVIPENMRLIDAGDLVMIGLYLMLLVVHGYCLFADAVLPLGEKPVVLATCYCAGGMMFLIPVIQSAMLFGQEMNSGMWMQLFGAATLFAIGGIHWAAQLRARE